MDIELSGFGMAHLSADGAMHAPAPCSTRHAALFVLAHGSALRPHALPGTPITALAGASNGRF